MEVQGRTCEEIKLFSLHILVLPWRSVGRAIWFLQNLYSSVRFRTPPPITTQITKQLSDKSGAGPLELRCAEKGLKCAKTLTKSKNQA